MADRLLRQLQLWRQLRDGAADDDAALLDRFRAARDEASFRAIVQRHGGLVRAAARRVLADDTEADDVFQATFLLLAERPGAVRKGAALGSWLYGAARRLALRSKRTTARQAKRALAAPPKLDGAARHAAAAELQAEVAAALERVPEPYRQALLCCYLEERSPEDAAKLLGCSVGTVWSRLARGREKLRRILERRGWPLGAAALAAALGGQAASAAVRPDQLQALLGLLTFRPEAALAPGLKASLATLLAQEKLMFSATTALRTLSAVLLLATVGLGAGGLLAWGRSEAAAHSPTALPTEPPKPAVDEGRLVGRVTAADTGKGLAGAVVRLAPRPEVSLADTVEAITNEEGDYSVAIPFGVVNLVDVRVPGPYFVHDTRKRLPYATSSATPTTRADFVAQKGTLWRLKVEGASEVDFAKAKLCGFPWPKVYPNRDVSPELRTHASFSPKGNAELGLPSADDNFIFQVSLGDRRYAVPVNVGITCDPHFDPSRIKGAATFDASSKIHKLVDEEGRACSLTHAAPHIADGKLTLVVAANKQTLPLPPKPAQDEGRLVGRVTAADTGKGLAGAVVTVVVDGVGETRMRTATSGPDGFYQISLPLGHAWLFAFQGPPGHRSTEARPALNFALTVAAKEFRKDFQLQPGATWRVEVKGPKYSADRPPVFTAISPEPARQQDGTGFATTRGDAAGRGALTLPPAGGEFTLAGGVSSLPTGYDIRPIKLKFDAGFDSERLAGQPEKDAKGIYRLRDQQGRAAQVEGAEIAVVDGKPTLRFVATELKAADHGVRGRVVDEQGKPIAGAEAVAFFETGTAGTMSQLSAKTDASGEFTLTSIMAPPPSSANAGQPSASVGVIVRKTGFAGCRSRLVPFRGLRPGETADLGNLTLKPGRKLAGKVVDLEGQPLRGSVVRCGTDPFVYSHLSCRTDADGNYELADLAEGPHRINVQFGEKTAQATTKVGDGRNILDITAGMNVVGQPAQRPMTDGQAGPPRPVAVDPAAVDRSIGKEPKYVGTPRYALLRFGKDGKRRAWLVADGQFVYVDRNGDGDLTGPDERVPLDETATKLGNAGGSDAFLAMKSFALGEVAGSRLTLNVWGRNPNFIPKGEADVKFAKEQTANDGENALLYRHVGEGGKAQNPILLCSDPKHAQVCHLEGPLSFGLKWAGMEEQLALKRGAIGSFDLKIGTPGIATPNGTFSPFSPLTTEEVPEGLRPVAFFEFPNQTPGGPSLKYVVTLEQRCCGDTFYGSVKAPAEAGVGKAKVTVTFPAWPQGDVAPTLLEVPIR